MPSFLSAEWIAALDAAARDSAALAVADADACVLEQRVVDVPERGEVRYHLVLGPSGARVHAGAAPKPDLTLTTDFVTAVALARGETNGQRALSAGKIRIGGGLEVLAKHSSALAGLGDVFASVRPTTEFAA